MYRFVQRINVSSDPGNSLETMGSPTVASGMPRGCLVPYKVRGMYEASCLSPPFRVPVARDKGTRTQKSFSTFSRSMDVSLNPILIPLFSGCVLANRNENCLYELMLSIADHVTSAEPVQQGSNIYKALRNDGRISAVRVFPFTVPAGEYQLFNERVSALSEAAYHNRIAIPNILSSGFTQTGNFPFLETEWIEGFDLTCLPNRYKDVTIDEIGNIAEQVSRVLTMCQGVGVVHGNIGGKHILWDRNREQYCLTGFQFGLRPPEQYSIGKTGNTNKDSDANLKQKDIHDLGLVLLTLINAHLLPGDGTQLTNSKNTLANVQLKDGTELPAWIGTCLYRTLSNNEERFNSAHEMYNYIILHHKTPFATGRKFRSKPQQAAGLPSKKARARIRSREKVQSAVASGVQTGRDNMRFVFDRRIALGLVMAGLLVTFSIIAQNRKNGNNAMAPTIGTGSMAMQDTTNNTAEQVTNQNTTVAAVGEKRKPAKTKQDADKQTALQETAATNVTTGQQERDSSLGAYKVKSRAYFHNQPDERTRRKAFIVHWNNAVLHPLKEENDFVYIVYSNDEGQTTKGWLRKKDLVKQ